MNYEQTLAAIMDFIQKVLIKFFEALEALGIEIDVYSLFEIPRPDDTTV